MVEVGPQMAFPTSPTQPQLWTTWTATRETFGGDITQNHLIINIYNWEVPYLYTNLYPNKLS